MWGRNSRSRLRHLCYAVGAVVLVNAVALLLVKTPLVAIIDELIPIGKRGIVPGGRRPAAISRWMAPVKLACRWILLPYEFADGNLPICVLIFIAEASLAVLLVWLVSSLICLLTRRSSPSGAQTSPGTAVPDSDENPYKPPSA